MVSDSQAESVLALTDRTIKTLLVSLCTRLLSGSNCPVGEWEKG